MELMPPRAHAHRGAEPTKHRLDPVNEKERKKNPGYKVNKTCRMLRYSARFRSF